MNHKVYYGLPSEVMFCKKTLMSNQKPNSAVEFTHNKNSKDTLKFDKKGISESWYYSRLKKKLIIILEKKTFKIIRKTQRQARSI